MNRKVMQAPLTQDKIRLINSESQTTVFVFENTRGLRIEDLQQISNNAVISIAGALNPRKSKFNQDKYIKRTYYKASELIQIIRVFEKIERKINPTWNDLEKCMFVYKSICEYSNYSECTYNNRDAARNLLGLITGKSVCSGYALIFKEAMDRLGIKCHYQNMSGSHSWNIIEIDGEFHAIDLTWDVNLKKNNDCKFNFFGREDSKFYNNQYHNIRNEHEETKFPVKEIPFEKLRETLIKISEPQTIIQKTNISNGEETVNFKNQQIVIKNGIPYLKGNNQIYTFIRQNNSSFLIIPTGNKKDTINEYYYISYRPQTREICAVKIYSEMNLITNDKELRSKISDLLLSSERVQSKFYNFNGYVGYVVKGQNCKYYNDEIEESLGVYR